MENEMWYKITLYIKQNTVYYILLTSLFKVLTSTKNESTPCIQIECLNNLKL